jgi:inorganic pyrophosphatase
VTFLHAQVALVLALTSLPETFELPVPSRTQGKEYDYKTVKNWYLFVCVTCGLWGGLAIGLQTEYFTSNRYRPVQVRAARACAAADITKSMFSSS